MRSKKKFEIPGKRQFTRRIKVQPLPTSSTQVEPPPIEVPKTMLPAISMIIIQFRNRRTGQRRTFQVAEILPDSTANVILQYEPKRDKLIQINKSKSLMNTLKLFTGFTNNEIQRDLKEKEKILNYLVKQNINTVDEVGRVIAEYYTNKQNLFRYVNRSKKLE